MCLLTGTPNFDYYGYTLAAEEGDRTSPEPLTL